MPNVVFSMYLILSLKGNGALSQKKWQHVLWIRLRRYAWEKTSKNIYSMYFSHFSIIPMTSQGRNFYLKTIEFLWMKMCLPLLLKYKLCYEHNFHAIKRTFSSYLHFTNFVFQAFLFRLKPAIISPLISTQIHIRFVKFFSPAK